MGRLRTLSVAKCFLLTGDALEHLHDTTASHLVTLRMSHCDGLRSRDLEREIPRFAALTALDLQWCDVSDDVMAAVTKLTHLRSLRLSSTTNWSLRLLSRSANMLSTLRELSFSGMSNSNRNSGGVTPLTTDDGLDHVMDLGGLEVLTIKMPNLITAAGFARLNMLSSLQSLRLEGCTCLGREVLSYAAQCTSLRDLRLRNCCISNSWLQEIARCLPLLEVVDLSWNSDVTSAGLLALQPLSHLRALILCGCGLSLTDEEGASALVALSMTTVPALLVDMRNLLLPSIRVVEFRKALAHSRLSLMMDEGLD